MAKLSGLLTFPLSDPDLRAVVDAARDVRADETPALLVEAPSALRPFLAAAFGTPVSDGGAGRTVLVVTATDREAEDGGAGSPRGRTPSGAAWRSSAGSPHRTRLPAWCLRRRGA